MSQPAEGSLARAELLLAQLIRSPLGVDAALEGDRAGGGELDEQLGALIHGDAERPPALRLQVYATAYFARLDEALRDDYPALAQAIGDGWFHDLAKLYVLTCPPRHPSLRYCGDRLAGFLREEAQAQPLRERFAWAADLAAFEWALRHAFDAENAEPLRAEHVAALAPELWGELELRADPALLLLELDWPVVALRRAHDTGEPLALEALAPRPERALVWRSGEQVSYRELEADEAHALAAVAAGATFGEICERAAQHVGEDEAPARAAGWLARWLADGCIRRGEPG